ncbi:LysR family transcriptional regulator [Herbaspirillum sp. LeCh32-8]|uniref:LysR family transcriptional regulator n=1 Tax=Herbaspirillum sp. LeCh32-8 TaxID=2821356 RepID=UPI001AEA48E3|nr:LysR family transcriptional regulator [Herbaspirillum sp. LeCh32-8]MBP0599019.1 LysR family transcriptional regulator [Herbaspirillum sp. LeCh32-8]
MTKSSPPPGSNAAGPLSAAGLSDRIELMQTFVRIVEAGSLSAAATQLGTTQPTVSRRLQALERSLGVRLLQRSTHAMKLTEDGERCYERAKDLLAGWDEFENELRGARLHAEGSLRVVVPHAFGQKQLIGPLAEFMRRHPRITVEWLLHDRAADFIMHGIDCAIEVGDVHDTSLVAIHLAEVPRMTVASPALLEGRALPRHPADLATFPWIAIPAFYRREITLTHAGSGEQKHVGFRPQLVTDSLYALRNAAIEGMGVAVGSSWILAEDVAAGRLVQLLPEWMPAPLPVSLLYPYARIYPARLRHFIDTMKEAMPAAVSGAVGWEALMRMKKED